MQKSIIAVAGVLLGSLLVAPATTRAPAADASEPPVRVASVAVPGTVDAATAGPKGAGTPWRVMFVGDSLVHSQTAMNTARFWVWRELYRQGVRARFVGPRNDLSKTRFPGIYNRLRLGFETSHAAMAGSRLRYHLHRLGQRIDTYRPDVVVLQVGFNDAKRHGPGPIARSTARYLNRTWARSPDTRFVVGQIPVTTDPRIRRRVNPRIRRANRLIARRWRGDDRVAIATTQTSRSPQWRPRRHTYDGTHPNATGETLLAQRYAEALHDLGVLPRAARVHRRVAWRPAIRPKARAGKRFIRVNIQNARLRAWARGAKVVVRGRNGVVRRTGHLRKRAVRIRVPRGVYNVRMQLTRGSMRGLTKVTRVQVR